MATSTKSNAISEKHSIIDNDNTKILIAVSIAVFVVVFCLFAVRALISQSFYHQRVITEKEEALRVLRDNTKAIGELENSYKAFVTEPINIIGGNPTGDGPRDGDNAKLVLDSLPSDYDFPALASSIEKILLDGGYQLESVGGDEDPTQEEGIVDSSTITSSQPDPILMPYPFSVTSDITSSVQLLKTLEASIRPFYINTLTITGQENSLELDIDLSTYYQPASGLKITTKEVK